MTRIHHGFNPGPAAALCLVLLTGSRAYADYPIASHRYLADPGSLVFSGRVYLYNSNDDDNPVEGGYQMKSIVCISSSDLKNWTDHGEVLRVPANASWAGNSWAPQPIERDGKIFLYFGNSGSGVGVASSTNPTGGFKDAKGGYLVNSNTPGASGTDSWLFDPGALIDDDGQAYLSFGGNGENNARIIKLGSDLASVSGTATQLSPKSFFEASFLFKRNGRYYFSYSTDPASGQRIDYLTSTSPMSGYTYGGIIAERPPSDSDDNNHASEFEFNGRWYHAYHNRYVATQAGIATTYRRNLGLEALDFDADGAIEQVTYTTDGVPQIGHLDPYVRVEAETMNAQSGIETETCSEGGMDVTQIHKGDWIKVRGVDFGSAGAKTFTARVASTASDGAIELRLGSLTGTLAGTCNVSPTGGQQTWGTTTCDVSGATGVTDLYLKFVGGDSQLFNFNYWQFEGGDGPATTDGGTTGSGGAAGNGGAARQDAGAPEGSASGRSGAGGARNAGGSSGGHAGTDGAGSRDTAAGAAGRAADAAGAGGEAGQPGGAGSGMAQGGSAGRGKVDPETGRSGGGGGGHDDVTAAAGSSHAPMANGTETGARGCSCQIGKPTLGGWPLPLLLLSLGACRRHGRNTPARRRERAFPAPP